MRGIEVPINSSPKNRQNTEIEDLASVIIVTYNSRHYMDACLQSVLSQDYSHEVIIVDNCSNDGTSDYVRKVYPRVTVIESLGNKGYGAGNNIGVRVARGNYIVILNPDVIVKEGWLRNLVTPLHDDEQLITTPKILVYDGSVINTIGNSNHFTGLTFTNGFGADPTSFSIPMMMTGISGACFALTKDTYIDLGGFDETFFLYNEDSDLSWRANLMGYRIVSTPDSVIHHDYTLKVSPEKMYYLEKGRYIILRKYLKKKDFLLLSPSLATAELLTFGYALTFGLKGLRYKFEAIIDGLNVGVTWIPDDNCHVLRSLESSIPVNQLTFSSIDRVVKVIANWIFEWNLWLIK